MSHGLPYFKPKALESAWCMAATGASNPSHSLKRLPPDRPASPVHPQFWRRALRVSLKNG